jgi:hypothetical protein
VGQQKSLQVGSLELGDDLCLGHRLRLVVRPA